MGRLVMFLYGIGCYVVFLGTFLYAIGFVTNLVVPRPINAPPIEPLAWALLVNTALLGLFAVQHSGMARKGLLGRNYRPLGFRTPALYLIAIQLEERDLVQAYGETYRQYRQRVSMLMPVPPKH